MLSWRERVSDEAVEELLQRTSQWPAIRQLDFWEIVGEILPAIELANTAEGERVCVELIRARFDERTFSEAIAGGIVRELMNYLPEARAAIVDACYDRIEKDAEADSDSGVMARKVAQAYGQLEPRAKALLSVFFELYQMDGYMNTTFFDEIRNEVWGADPTILRDDPALAVLLRAYDVAKVVNANSR